jgi:flagellin FlaB
MMRTKKRCTRMRKKWTRMRRDRRADIGIGTMIVFIAMVLVAAVAAAVLISTANQVREQATSTGDQAINNVAAGLMKVGVTGKADADGSELGTVNVKLKLASGSPDILIANVVVNTIEAGVAQSDQAVTWSFLLNIPDDTQTTSIGQGDLVMLAITPDTALTPLTTMEISIIPAFGQPTYITFMVPETLIANQVYVLG